MSKKRYGQNFLINNEVIDKILTKTEIFSKNSMRHQYKNYVPS